jgi:hypothetical protein
MVLEQAAFLSSVFGLTYRIEEIDKQGLFVLDVRSDMDERFGGFRNDIRLEAEVLEEVT